ncbi:MAG TPA: cytochrome c [Gammaproteobacteria bacterium]|nr:cytochrome c [Gammaproteobacteria bacterium]
MAVLYNPVYAKDNQIDASNNQPTSLSEQRRAELKDLLLQDCGSCHGMTLKGGLGPALTPDVLHNKSRQMITVTITEGRPGTPMPPWKTILSEQEIHWLVETLYSGVTP